MKNLATKSLTTSAVFAAALLMQPSEPNAASLGTLSLAGVVVPVSDVTVTSQDKATALSITGGETDALIAVINEKNNNSTGYTVTMVPASAVGDGQPNLVGLSTVTYSLKYGVSGSEAALSTYNTTTGAVIATDSSSATAAAGVDKNLKITIPAVAGALAGAYADTIAITIANK